MRDHFVKHGAVQTVHIIVACAVLQFGKVFKIQTSKSVRVLFLTLHCRQDNHEPLPVSGHGHQLLHD